MLPGTYYVNPLLFKVILESAKEVRPGEVAVIVSNTGKDPSGAPGPKFAKGGSGKMYSFTPSQDAKAGQTGAR